MLITVTGRNGTILLSLQMISLHLIWFCWDCPTNTLLFASSLKRFTLAFEDFKLEGDLELDAEGVSCVAGLLKGFRSFWEKKKINSSKDSVALQGKKLPTKLKGRSHIHHSVVLKLLPTNTKKKNLSSCGILNQLGRGGKGWLINIFHCILFGRKGKKEQSSGSAHTQVFAVSRKNLQRSKCKLFSSFQLKIHWN